MSFTNAEVLHLTDISLNPPTVINNNSNSGFSSTPWVYPSDWPDLEADWPMNGSERVSAIRYLFSDRGDDVCRLICLVVNGGEYTVDWGDGYVDTWISGETAHHEYVKGTGKPCSLGYTTFVITVCATNPLNHLFNIHLPYGINSIRACIIDYPELMDLFELCYMNSGVEYVKFLCGFNIPISMNCAFFDCFELRVVEFTQEITVTDITAIFVGCKIIESIDLSKLRSDFPVPSDEVFNECYSLKEVKVTKALHFAEVSFMFNETAITHLDTRNFSLPADCSTFAGYAYSLEEVIWDHADVTILYNAFTYCRSLKKFTLLCDLSNVTSMDRTFEYTMLEYFDFETANLQNVTDMSECFQATQLKRLDLRLCNSLTKVDRMITNVNTLQEFLYLSTTFNKIISAWDFMKNSPFTSNFSWDTFHSLGTFNTTTGYSTSGLNDDMDLPELIPYAEVVSDTLGKDFVGSIYFNTSYTLLNRVILPHLSFKFFSAEYNTALVEWDFKIGSPFDYGTSPIRLTYTGLSASALNTIFSKLPTVSGKTIVITGSVGAPGCDRSIATSKGWTVSG